ncbi:fasciclin-like arabinogalactan protein 10 [Pyrus ussuriensis x Pyrus communis]|uniref:Fasciclin-like arabinogalactan protein 10 n=1 Tax=Pyrus ussuriensis x Pyrus communis TaxID=2448454 RepID=A0A5N5GCV9_9ROSA|nr:fasciclin-like arabinogalactan protein 10 [Pyrus ussuriensis x Pyrus communis]
MYLQKFNAPVAYLLLSFLFVFFSSSSAYNITDVLSKYPDFSIFNDYLTKTEVCNQINEHRLMTVLAVNNAAMSSLVGKSMDVINKVILIHVFLESYTLTKFKSLPTSQTTQVTTLFESPDQQRYLNITNGDSVSIVSAAGSEKVEVVRDISPDDIYRISVVQVSNLILPSSLSSSPSPSASSPTPTPSPSSPSPTPSPSPSAPSSSPSPTPSPSPSTPSPTPSPSPSTTSPSPSSSMFNITQILNKYPEFSIFNDYLTRTQVCDQINERRTLTILVPNNEAMYSLVGQPMDMIRKVLSTQVVLDYYTISKFHNLPVSQSTRIITLLEASDKPSGQQGFVNVTNGDTISIVSAVGSDQAAIVRDIASDENYYISVVQISKVIMPSGFISPSSSPSPSVSSPSPSVPSPSLSVPSPSPSSPPSSPTSSTLNITKILNDYPDFSQFNSYLTDTQVCDQINVRTSITVFVVNNAAMSYLVGKSNEVKKRLLSLHVVMDYYTFDKFKSFPNSQTTQLTTLLQDTFQSIGFEGLLNATNGDTVSIVSAAGSEKAKVVKDIFTENLKLSVVQLSNLIVPVDSNSSPSPSVPSPSLSPPAPSSSHLSPSPSTSAPSPSPLPSPPSGPFDITKILSNNPDFSLFSTYLTQTQVANQVNERKTMTVFVVNNDAMASLVDKPMEIKKKVLSLHVIMDYYTVQSFYNLPASQTIRIKTLLQVIDRPSGLQGLVNVTNGDTITIVSTAGSDQAVVVRDVANDERSYISVVQISNIILPSSFIAPTPSPSSTPGKARSAAPVQAPSGSPAPEAPKQGEAPPPSNATSPDTPKQGEAPRASNATAPVEPKQGETPQASNATAPGAPKQGETPPFSNATTPKAANQGEAPSTNAPASDVPSSLDVAPSSESTLQGTTSAAPTLSGSPARFSVDCALFITTILVTVYSLTCIRLT